MCVPAASLVVGGGAEAGLTLFPEGRPADLLFFARPLLTCRIYTVDGRVSPVPSRAQLEEALR